jgi:hypothetical protein
MHFSGGGGGGMHFAGGGGGGMHFSGAAANHFAAAPNVAAPRMATAPAARVAAAPMVQPGGTTWTGNRTAWNSGNWRGDWHHGFRHRGFFPGAAIGAFAFYGGPDYAYDYGPDYYDDTYYDSGYVAGPEVAVVQGGGDASYCAQRYRSWDPATGTYLGYDGQRHPCP